MTRSFKLLWTVALGAFLVAAVSSCNESKETEAAEHSTTDNSTSATTTTPGTASGETFNPVIDFYSDYLVCKCEALSIELHAATRIVRSRTLSM